MKNRILIFFFCIYSFVLIGQTDLDSLYRVWMDESQTDSIRCKAVDDFIWEGLIYNQPDSAFRLAKEFYQFTLDKEDLLQQCYALNTLGTSQWYNYEYVSAISYFEKSLALSKEIGNTRGIAIANNNIGGIHYDRGYYPKALEYYNKSIELYKQLDIEAGIAVTSSNIGKIYKEQGELEKALANQKQSLEIYERLGDKYGIAKEMLNLGSIYASRKKYDLALEYYKKSSEVREEIKDLYGLSIAMEMTGSLLSLMGRFDEAIRYHEKSISLAKKSGDRRGLAIGSMEYGQTLIKAGQIDKARTYCLQAFPILKEMNLFKQLKDACNCLYLSYEKKNDPRNALKYFKLEQEIRDSLQETETAKKLQKMEFQKAMLQDSIANAERERQLKEAHAKEVFKKERTRNIAFVIVAFVLMALLALYSRLRYIRSSKKIIEKERDRSESLLLNILPAEVAEELKENGRADARDYDMVSILFTDFKEFTQTSEKLSAGELVDEINCCFEAFDGIIEKHGIEKIKTIGDAYMAAGGLPVPTDSSVKNAVLAALEMQDFIIDRKKELESQDRTAFEMRVGIHTGPVVAGIVGVKKFQYDIWGDTVNTASRMESSGKVGKVNISQVTYELLKDDPDFEFESRGKVVAKGKGEIEMYFVKIRI